MTERKYVEGKKPDRDIPADKIGRLELAPEGDRPAGPEEAEEASGRTSPFWVKCWSCHKYLTRPLSPPSEQAYTCPNCGAVNMMHDSLSPLGGLVPLINMMLGEVIFGGVGAGFRS